MATDGYIIRACRPEEVAKLGEIERRAAQMFAATPYAFLCNAPTMPAESLRRHLQVGAVWVAADNCDEPVGFAVAGEVGGDGYLYELDIDPQHGRRGLGRCLVETVCEWAQTVGYGGVTLSTFADIAWNAPFYAALGFKVMNEDELTVELRALRGQEAAAGLPIARRVFMQRGGESSEL